MQPHPLTRGLYSTIDLAHDQGISFGVHMTSNEGTMAIIKMATNIDHAIDVHDP
jgi:hypothetical protein